MGWTYKGENGYAPIFAYLGAEGFALAAELRPGTQHCSKGGLAFVERCAGLAEAAEEARQDAGAHGHRHPAEGGRARRQPCGEDRPQAGEELPRLRPIPVDFTAMLPAMNGLCTWKIEMAWPGGDARLDGRAQKT